jgi:hypothetical protein
VNALEALIWRPVVTSALLQAPTPSAAKSELLIDHEFVMSRCNIIVAAHH